MRSKSASVEGDAAWQSHIVIIAALEGTIAALATNTELLNLDIPKRSTGIARATLSIHWPPLRP
jgi:hypothetical protein